MRASLVFTTSVAVVRPLMVLLAVVLYLKGHNSAGGGFIAGLMTAVAVLLAWISLGPGHRRGVWPLLCIAGGLGLSLMVTLGGFVAGQAVFTHAIAHLELPWLGTLELPSAALFDLGIYLVVVGNVATVLGSMAEAR